MVKSNGLAAIAYLFGLITGILVFLVSEKSDKLVRFHAAQSIFFSITSAIIGAILAAVSVLAFGGWWMWGMPMGVFNPFAVVSIIMWVVYGIVIFLIWLFLILKAYSGQKHKLPLIGNLAESISG